MLGHLQRGFLVRRDNRESHDRKADRFHGVGEDEPMPKLLKAVRRKTQK